jgi:hypothetical protein
VSALGIAIHEAGLVAVARERGSERVTSHDWDVTSFRDALSRGDTDALVRIIAPAYAVVRTSVVPARDIAVALVPPLSHVRSVELPPMRIEEARQVLARDAARYFVGVTGPQGVAIASPPTRDKLPIAAAASGVLLEAIRRVVVDAGSPSPRIVPAHAAWAAAGGRANRVVIVEHTGATVLQLVDGAPSVIRRVRGVDPDRISAALLNGDSGEPITVMLAGPDQSTKHIAEQLRARRDVPHITRVASGDALTLAARHAPDAASLLLRSRFDEESRSAGTQRLTRVLYGITALLAVVGATLQLWGERRELSLLRAERARIAPRVERAFSAYGVLQQREDRVRTITSLVAARPAWSSIVARTALAVPSDAYLSAMRMSGDTLVLEGLASSAAEVVQALRATPGFGEVRPLAPFRRERSGAAESEDRERFTLAIRLVASEGTR